MRDRIEKLIDKTISVSLPWIVSRDGVVQFVDPLDKKEISAHYGASHMAVSLIIYGSLKHEESPVKQGEDLLFSVLDRWNENKELPDFHNDFNNFALCVLDHFTDKYHERIKETVLGTKDTFFDTINWLPMRWFVNLTRYKWTGDVSYKDICQKCMQTISQATYSDGFIEDMLPLGRSFSLQYDVATVAFMQYLRVMGEDIDLSVQTGALLNAVYPDGDINYFGRGTNQIFAWGLWIYLLASSGQNELDRALGYIEKRLPEMLENNNIMLNDYPGEEKFMWWDYHYSSVYTAHLLFWLIMALKDFDKCSIEPRLISDGSSGVCISRNDNAFVVTFDGRTEYLAEAGPSVVALWTKQSGPVIKGEFGPWYGLFGNKYAQPDVVMKNYMGLIKTESEQSNRRRNRVFTKLFGENKKCVAGMNRPVFIAPSVDISEKVRLTYHVNGMPLLLNVPSFGGNITVSADGEQVIMSDTMKIRNQYDWLTIKQKLIDSANVIEVEVL